MMDYLMFCKINFELEKAPENGRKYFPLENINNTPWQIKIPQSEAYFFKYFFDEMFIDNWTTKTGRCFKRAKKTLFCLIKFITNIEFIEFQQGFARSEQTPKGRLLKSDFSPWRWFCFLWKHYAPAWPKIHCTASITILTSSGWSILLELTIVKFRP